MASNGCVVAPLSLGGLHVLISTRLGRSFLRPTIVRIAEISGGNPFFASEWPARSMSGPGTQSGLPASRCDEVSAGPRRTKTVAGAASVANPTVELLAQVTDAPVELLGEAEAKGIAGIDGNLVRFAHPLPPTASTPTRVGLSTAPCTGYWRRPRRCPD